MICQSVYDFKVSLVTTDSETVQLHWGPWGGGSHIASGPLAMKWLAYMS